MSVGGVSTASASQQAAWQQRRQDMNSLMTAAQSGDVASAQKAFASLTADKAPPANSPLAALGAALQSGDATAIQKAATDMQNALGSRHHHKQMQSQDVTQVTTPRAQTPGATVSIIV